MLFYPLQICSPELPIIVRALTQNEHIQVCCNWEEPGAILHMNERFLANCIDSVVPTIVSPKLIYSLFKKESTLKKQVCFLQDILSIAAIHVIYIASVGTLVSSHAAHRASVNLSKNNGSKLISNPTRCLQLRKGKQAHGIAVKRIIIVLSQHHNAPF